MTLLIIFGFRGHTWAMLYAATFSSLAAAFAFLVSVLLPEGREERQCLTPRTKV